MRKKQNLTISECEHLTQIIVCDSRKTKTKQNEFDTLMRQYQRYVTAFSREHLYLIIREQLRDLEKKYAEYIRSKVVKRSLKKLLSNSVVVTLDYDNRTYIYTKEDYNRELQQLCRMTVIKYSSEHQINKRLIRDNIATKEFVNRKALRYDKYLLSLVRDYLRQLKILETLYIDVKKFSVMTRSERSMKRLTRKKLAKQINKRQYDTKRLLTKLKLC